MLNTHNKSSMLNTQYKGFNNIGNTCYFNSGLQLIIQNKELCNLIIDQPNKNDFLKELSEFILLYYNSPTDALTPDKIKKYTKFLDFRQHDSSELIINILDMINEANSNKIVSKLYDTTQNIKIKCKLRVCLNISAHDEKINYLMLDLKNGFETLDDCYKEYKTRIKLIDDNLYWCEKCRDKRVASKRLEITNWSKHLIIILKRFEESGSRYQKNDMNLNIPIEWRHGYILKGFVIHSGSLHGGHYVYVGNHNGKWILFNDSSTKEISENEVNSYLKTAYVLYYEKSY